MSKKLCVVALPVFLTIMLMSVDSAIIGSSVNSSSQFMPTSTPENREFVSRVESLVSDEDCEIPCFWGWTVGVDNLETVQETSQANLGKVLFTSVRQNHTRLGLTLSGLVNYEIEGANVYGDPRLELWTDNEIDQLVIANLYVEIPRAGFIDWGSYLISKILTRYGSPDEVVFTYVSITGPITVVIRYNSLNLYFEYAIDQNMTVQRAAEGEPLVLCNDTERILWFQISVHSTPEDAEIPIAPIGNPAAISESEIDLQELSDLTIEEFTKVFSQPNQCFETIPVNELFAPTD